MFTAQLVIDVKAAAMYTFRNDSMRKILDVKTKIV